MMGWSWESFDIGFVLAAVIGIVLLILVIIYAWPVLSDVGAKAILGGAL